MANSGSYARGDQPRSVPDHDGPAYAAMGRRQQAYNAKQQAALVQRAESKDDYWSTHPGTAESVWGSAREAVADYREGDMVGAVATGALAVADLTGQGYMAKSFAKGGPKIGGSHAWKRTREWMGEKGKGILEKNQHGHHWLIP